jgi:hypothetical protein
VANERSKPRIAAYGLYTLDARGIALRCWLDYRRQRVCSVSCVVPHGAIIWAYCLYGPRQSLADDLCTAVVRAGYRCFTVAPQEAARRLEVRYDVENAYPISAGETAGIANCQVSAATCARRSPGRPIGPSLFQRFPKAGP